ncbi:replication-associated protein [Golden silk orbweaver associated circular virus 1]|uniref:Replication-associated protein n=1 Tax=Golden silk orbweaver associated circular virus 1 TaxID=2293292 RepID=A0A346BPA4_9VIRU|nr:replication-associated protein [Golden silk orbweaver associated circular virus 1]AXL65901.1 replication-associated protein [Golden silk orbweaver associated circular virus 1]
MSKCKRWLFTSYNVVSEPFYDEKIHEYLCFGRETCPSTNRRHLQGYVAFKNRITLAGIKKWIPGAHFERARGTPTENRDYCKKDGDFKEWGSVPTVTGRACKFGDILHLAESGNITCIKDTYPGVYLRYKATLLSSLVCNTTDLKNSCGVWLCGPPRSGKDYAVRQLDNVYMKMLNKWWDGYKNEDNVLISDIEPDHGKWIGYYIKIWCDMYAFNAEIKGGSMKIRPKKIFMTSNYKLDEVFSGEILSAVAARCNVYDYSNGCDVIVTKRMSPSPSDVFISALKEHEDGLSFTKEVLQTSSCLQEEAISSISEESSNTCIEE